VLRVSRVSAKSSSMPLAKPQPSLARCMRVNFMPKFGFRAFATDGEAKYFDQFQTDCCAPLSVPLLPYPSLVSLDNYSSCWCHYYCRCCCGLRNHCQHQSVSMKEDGEQASISFRHEFTYAIRDTGYYF
jgi:hypothetical protein